MKKTMLRSFVITGVFAFVFGFSSCKNKAKEGNTDIDSSSMINNAPVNVSSDETLTRSVQDAIKDYPGVQATVTNGEVTLAGTIEKDRLPRLMSDIQGLNLKKVNNLLEVK